jgi:hypothetical protein
MKAIILAASLIPCAWCAAQDASLEQLLAHMDPAVQEQIARTYAAFELSHFELDGNVEAFEKLQKLKGLTQDKEELLKQLTIFVVTTESEENSHVTLTLVILENLRLATKVTIRALAPYLETDNASLREFVRDWFQGHDDAGPNKSPLKPVNYDDYQDYVMWKVNRNREVPAPFVRYIYERSPGGALLIFARASGSGDLVARLHLMQKAFEDRQQGKESEPQREAVQQLDERRKVRSRVQRQIQLAEHIVSNAIWLDKHGYIVRFQKALPEAQEALVTLAQGEWWARLYVVYIMRQNPVLLKDNILRQLAEDENELVRGAAKSGTPETK